MAGPMNKIHPTAIIGDSVKLGSNNIVGPFVVLMGNVEIGDNNWFGPHSSIGAPAEILGSDLPSTWDSGVHKGKVSIGSRNVIREGCVIHAGFYTGTCIASDCYIMNQTYIAHDCNIESRVALSSNVTLGGHVTIQNGANLGMSTVVHQRRIIGARSMIGMGSIVTKDLVPYIKAFGNPCRPHGGNIVGMQRMGLDDSMISRIVEALNNSDMKTLRLLIPTEMEVFDTARTAQQQN